MKKGLIFLLFLITSILTVSEVNAFADDRRNENICTCNCGGTTSPTLPVYYPPQQPQQQLFSTMQGELPACKEWEEKYKREREISGCLLHTEEESRRYCMKKVFDTYSIDSNRSGTR